jgi:hypothetical protein
LVHTRRAHPQSRKRGVADRASRGPSCTGGTVSARPAIGDAALANSRGPVKQCPAAAPPELVFEEELEALGDEDEADENIIPAVR